MISLSKNIISQGDERMKKIKVLCVLGLSLVVLAACGSTDKKEVVKSVDSAAPASSSVVEKKEDKKEESKDVTFENNTLTTKDAVIQYTGSEKGTDYDGKPLLYVFLTITNKEEEPQDGQMMILAHLEFSQNLGATTKRLEYAITMDDPYKDKLELMRQSVNKDGTIETVYPVLIDDESKPVTITFSDKMFGKKVAEIEVQ